MVIGGAEHGFCKIEPFIITNFYSKMFQQIESGFVAGERYCVKNKGGFKKDLIFIKHGYSGTGLWFDDPDKPYGYLLSLHEIKIYKYISIQDYYAKLKEKYDVKCLNSVLKNLVNEHFEW
jgi:superfamily I DNA and/or RNA helicase